jgi:hypothetical protein
MWLMFGSVTVMDTLGALFSLTVSVFGAGLSLDCLGALYSAYRRAAMRLEDERWLLENGKDPVFFTKMKAHPTVCNEVETNARIGALWTALKEVTDGARVTWQPYVVGFAAAILMLLPLCWMCAARVSSRGRGRRQWEECIQVHGDFAPMCRKRVGY